MSDDLTQLESLRSLIEKLLAGNAFYGPRLRDAGLGGPVDSLESFVVQMPVTTKAELVEDQRSHPPFGSNLTFPIEAYTHFCQTSGTTGRPMVWLDTAASWASMLSCWKRVYDAAGCREGERVLFAFSFGPFLGFWTAFEAAQQAGYLCLPGGGMSSTSRLRLMGEMTATTLCCTPTYALRLAEVAQQESLVFPGLKRIIVAGEPGGSVPAVRKRIEAGWPGVKVFDHHGMTEVGPVTYQEPGRVGCLRMMEDAYFAEVVDPQTLEAVEDGRRGELVLTTLLRDASPLLRYRTGDLVVRDPDDRGLLVGGVLGRIDDMAVVRGVNVYPSAVDALVRGFAEVTEYRATLERGDGMSELSLEIEPAVGEVDSNTLSARVAEALRDALQLRVAVSVVEQGALPRFEMKAKRWVVRDV